ncbi:MAG: hypothetical protein M1820_007086 [Bogoriella megaspora]|nr:MAG: hypothetical protein M1820_007086 [Bogoriella megaspora]
MKKPQSTSIPYYQGDLPIPRAHSQAKAPSSSTAGFFQIAPKVLNQLEDDIILQRIVKLYLPLPDQNSISPELDRFANLVLSPQVFTWVADAERNLPYVRTWDVWGKRKDELVTSEGWRNLQKLGIEEGIVAIPYERKHGSLSRLYQFLKYHIWAASNAYVICPSAMTDGAAMLLKKTVARLEADGKDIDEQQKIKVLRSAYEHLISRDPTIAWTSGQWMTERVGGSDVRNIETQATYSPTTTSSATSPDGLPLGPWSITGFKWFSSATDANTTILLARDPSGGISAFYAPLQRTTSSPSPSSLSTTEPNGVQIQRLKSKLGTRALPTAELELRNTRAYLLGPLGQGTKQIATVLNITRVHNAVTAVGFWGRGLGISRAFARVRRVGGGRLLCDVAAHVKGLAELTVDYAGVMQVVYFVVVVLGVCEGKEFGEGKGGGGDVEMPRLLEGMGWQQVKGLLRLLTPVVKAVSALKAIGSLSKLMESLGGVGYVDDSGDPETNIARLLRDAQVLSIWEGTTDVMAMDLVRVLKGRDGNVVIDALESWVRLRIGSWQGGSGHGMSELEQMIGRRVSAVLSKLVECVRDRDADTLAYMGRELLDGLGWIMGAILLVEDARRDQDPVASEITRRWVVAKELPWLHQLDDVHVHESQSWDKEIVFGHPSLSAVASSKL